MSLCRAACEILGTVALGLVAGAIFAGLLCGSELLAAAVDLILAAIRSGLLSS